MHLVTWLRRYNYLAMTLILGSFGKLFVFFTLVWYYNPVIYTVLLDLYIFASQAVALRVFLDVTQTQAACVIASSVLLRRALMTVLSYFL